MRSAGAFFALLLSCAGPPGEPPERDYRGILHCHSLYSHDSQGSYPEILAAAKAAGIDFICMTDHPPKGDPGRSLREGWTGLHEGVLFIQGAEYSDQILALGIKEPISGLDRRGRIRAIHEQGGLAFACHPEEIKEWEEFEEADGMEIYNVHAALKKRSRDPLFVAQAAKILREDPEHSFELLRELDPAVLKRWDEINRRRLFPGIAGNDSHQNVNLLGVQLDPYARAFRFVTTHVRARELSEGAILGALKEGRAYVLFENGLPPGARDLELRTGKNALGPWLEVRGIESPPSGGEVVLYRDGEPVEPAAHSGPRYLLIQSGTYRVAGTVLGSSPRKIPWFLTNPVRVGD